VAVSTDRHFRAVGTPDIATALRSSRIIAGQWWQAHGLSDIAPLAFSRRARPGARVGLRFAPKSLMAAFGQKQT